MIYRQNMFSPKRLQSLGPFVGSRGNTYRFKDENGTLYYGKTASASHPFAVANEYVAGLLAKELEFEIPDFGLRELEGVWYFLSRESRFPTARDLGYAFVQDRVFAESFASVITFDCWIMNTDRHAGNYLLRYDNLGYHVVVIDHDRALFSQGTTIPFLMQANERPCAYLMHMDIEKILVRKRNLTLPMSHVARTIASIQNVPPETVAGIVRSVPEDILSDEEATALVEVLLMRQTRLDGLLDALTTDVLFRSAFVR